VAAVVLVALETMRYYPIFLAMVALGQHRQSLAHLLFMLAVVVVDLLLDQLQARAALEVVEPAAVL
jgi:hypothetical protein